MSMPYKYNINIIIITQIIHRQIIQTQKLTSEKTMKKGRVSFVYLLINLLTFNTKSSGPTTCRQLADLTSTRRQIIFVLSTH